MTTYSERALELIRRNPNARDLVEALNHHSMALLAQTGDVELVRADLFEARDIAAESGVALLITRTLMNLAAVESTWGDRSAGLSYAQAALAAEPPDTSPLVRNAVRDNVANAMLDSGEAPRSLVPLLIECLDAAVSARSPRRAADALELVAKAVVEEGPEPAARLLSAARALRVRNGLPTDLSDMGPTGLRSVIDRVESALPAEELQGLYAAMADLDLDGAHRLALAIVHGTLDGSEPRRGAAH